MIRGYSWACPGLAQVGPFGAILSEMTQMSQANAVSPAGKTHFETLPSDRATELNLHIRMSHVPSRSWKTS
jgi:hypothetical protein